jgi:nucleotide-binding universal stress UspA family protein
MAQEPKAQDPGAKQLWRSILVATDLSDAADEAIRQAHEQARLFHARLKALHVLPSWPGTPMAYGEAEREVLERERLSAEILDAVTARVESLVGSSGDVGFGAVLDDGLASDAIVRRAEAMGADLVVVGGTGKESRTGVRRLLGGVAESVVRNCSQSVLVARPQPGTHRVLCAVDLSPASWAVARAAVALHMITGDELQVVHALAPGEHAAEATKRLEGVVAELGHGVARLIAGAPDVALPALAADERADLVVIGTTGRGGLRGLLLGSAAHAVARDAPCSVLVVRGAR